MTTNGFPGGMPGVQLYLGKDGKVFGPFTSQQVDGLRKTGEIASYHWLWDGSGQWVPANPPPPMMPACPPGGAGVQVAAPVAQATAPVAQATAPVAQVAMPISVTVEPVGQFTMAVGPVEPAVPAAEQYAPMAPAAASNPARKQYAPAFNHTQEPSHIQNQQTVAGPSASAHPLVGLSKIRAVCFDQHRNVMSGKLLYATPDGCALLMSLSVCPERAQIWRGRAIWLNLVHEPTGKSENVRAVFSDGLRRDGGLELRLQWDRVPGILSHVA